MTPEARAFAGDGIRPRPRLRARQEEPKGAAEQDSPVDSSAPPEAAVGDDAARTEDVAAAGAAAPGPPGSAPDSSAAPGEEPAHIESRPPHVVIVGGGGTGGALAHDLALRGLRVTLVERGDVTSGSTGRHQGLLHSGARYARTDPPTAGDCVAENRILRRIAAGSFEENDGLFVALTDEEAESETAFFEACWQAAVPARRLTRAQALSLEPGLHPGLRLAVQVSDATMDAMRLPLRFFATARSNGAEIRTFTEVTGLLRSGACVEGVAIRDHVAGQDLEIRADLVVNAAGAWAGLVAAMADVTLPMTLEAAVLVAVRGRHCNMVLNRLGDAGPGDLLVPQRNQTVLAGSFVSVDDPQPAAATDGATAMVERAAEVLPAIGGAAIRASWSSVRPVFHDRVRPRRGATPVGRETLCVDHAAGARPVDGLVTIAGGNASSLRLMAERAGDLVCRKLGVDRACQTSEQPLLPDSAWYAR